MAAVLKQHEEFSPCPAEAVWHHPPNTLAGRQKGTVGTQRREMVGLSVLLSLMLFCWRLKLPQEARACCVRSRPAPFHLLIELCAHSCYPSQPCASLSSASFDAI